MSDPCRRRNVREGIVEEALVSEPVAASVEGEDAFRRHLIQVFRVDRVELLAGDRELLCARHFVREYC